MKGIDELNVKELKEMCKRANETELFSPKIRYNGVKNVVAYDNFVNAIYELNEEEVAAVYEKDESIMTYYNDLFDQEEPLVKEEEEEELVTEPEDVSELDFEESGKTQEPLDVPPEEEIVATFEKVVDVVDPDSTPAPEQELVSGNSEEELEPVKPKRTLVRLSRTPMHPSIDGSILTVNFKELSVAKTFQLPKYGDKEALRAVRKEAFAFAKENGATTGQCQHISKELNMAGYYMR